MFIFAVKIFRTMKISSLLSILLISLTQLVSAQDTADNLPPNIFVTGTAEKEVIPDEIFIRIKISEAVINKEKKSVEAQEAELKSSLQKIGINLKNLFLSDAGADYIKVTRRTKDVVSSKEYTLQVQDAATVGKVFEQLDNLQIKDASVARVNYSKSDSLKKVVHVAAILAAKEKAEYLLAALGKTIGNPLNIIEIEYNMFPMMANVRASGNEVGDMNAQNDVEPLQFSKIKVQATIQARFAIK